MDGLIGKLRAFAFDTKGQGGVGREGPFGFPGESPKACFQCDVDLGGKAWVQCSICGYVFCRQCCAAEKGGGVDGTAAWPEGGARPACDFCECMHFAHVVSTLQNAVRSCWSPLEAGIPDTAVPRCKWRHAYRVGG
eukprot:1157870-Pelagomonas_calceolata.AAC.1